MRCKAKTVDCATGCSFDDADIRTREYLRKVQSTRKHDASEGFCGSSLADVGSALQEADFAQPHCLLCRFCCTVTDELGSSAATAGVVGAPRWHRACLGGWEWRCRRRRLPLGRGTGCRVGIDEPRQWVFFICIQGIEKPFIGQLAPGWDSHLQLQDGPTR